MSIGLKGSLLILLWYAQQTERADSVCDIGLWSGVCENNVGKNVRNIGPHDRFIYTHFENVRFCCAHVAT